MSKKILFFFPENPFSNRAGNVTRAKSTLSILKKLGHQIDLVGVRHIYNDMQDTIEVDRNIVDNLFFITPRPPKKKTSIEYWKYKILKSYKKTNQSNPSLTNFIKKEFKDIFAKKKYDVIIINYEFWAGLLDDSMKNSTKIIDTHDWITLNEFYKNKSLDIGKRFNEEINNLSKFNKVVTISNDEYFIFKSFFGDKVINIPPSFPENLSYENEEKHYDLIFTGSDNPFNIEGIGWFLEKVLPLLPATVKICVIGRVCKYIPKHKNIRKIDFAEDLKVYYKQSKIAICPMLRGTGIKIKVVEALSFGLPVVGNEKAFDGFSQKIANGCCTAYNENDFAEMIIKLLSNQTEYQKLAVEAVDFFKSNFSENKITKLWESIINN
ncbi:hypothetical protein ACM39_15480 [Chryseobacterium sp. FH2]|uniref:glycosyltransferase family 4 protein n=1 Tax=Chryseobacterium sp. FH2 TaxID=1674291 RepID=UPI00065AEF9B|nr:glycosyltransferase family 4 protein [Chryseobacterium sp. FH2]KMQ67172.1 hypothetical protein ACM39_15480 [Chryseobacterium sp. FH2]